MAHKPLTAKQVERILEARREGRSFREIGEELGINSSTAHRYVKKYEGEAPSTSSERPNSEEIDQPVDDRGPAGGETRILTRERPRTLEEMRELFGIDERLWVPQLVRANEWNGFYKLKDGVGHRKVALWQTRVVWKRVVPEEVEEAILEFVREHVEPLPRGALPPSAERGRGDPQLVVWGLWDAHLGMHAWRGEVGEDYDLRIAGRRVRNSIDDMVDELAPYNVSKILMPVGNDFMHFDNVRHKTSMGEHYLDTDNRFGKVYLEALRSLSYQVERGLEICKNLELLYVPGNHDLATSYTLCVALAERFRYEPRVQVDLGFCPQKWRRHGATLLMFEHGQKVKKERLALTMAELCREAWHECRYREVQIGHTHQRREQMFESLTPVNGVLVRTNPSLSNVDSWHFHQGMLGEPTKSVEAWRYDETGYRGSHVTWARDEP